ncbi:MAG: hypothetical protein HYX74_02280 [Acidobacteria bacterium]|nr:hypothetical protein [Acidobacteriota bacterium]
MQNGAFFRTTKIIKRPPRWWNHLSLDLAGEYDALVRTHIHENQERYLFENLPVASVRFEMFSWTEGDGEIAVAYDNVKLIPLSPETQAGRRAEAR